MLQGDSGSGAWLPSANGQPAQLFGVLHAMTVCEVPRGSPIYVDVLNEEVRDFLSEFFDMSDSEITKSASASASLGGIAFG